MLLMPRDDIPVKVHFWMAMISPVLLPFKSKIIEGIVSYSEQRVLRQLGYVEGVITITG